MQTSQARFIDTGLLVIRMGIAAALLVYAMPRLLDGNGSWALVGEEISLLKDVLPARVTGLVILAIQVLAAVGLVSGCLFRLSALLATAGYAIYFYNFISSDYRTLPLYAVALACTCLGLLISGAGRYAVAGIVVKR